MTVYIGLLRAVNLGGGTQVPMDRLRGLLAEIGFEEGRTLLQSGNVVFRSRSGDEPSLERTLAQAVARKMGVRTEAFVRSAEDGVERLFPRSCPGESRAGRLPEIPDSGPGPARLQPCLIESGMIQFVV